MKRLIFFMLCAANFCAAQEIDETPDDPNTAEKAEVSFRITPQNLDFFDISCKGNFTPPQFPGGNAAFSEEIAKRLNAGLSRNLYAPNGTFNIVFMVDSSGKMSNVTIGPKVQNSEIFYRDMKFSAEKIEKTWLPAACSGMPVASVIRLKINFISDEADM